MSITRKEAENIALVLSEGLPYIQRFQGKIIVIKYGGAAMSRDDLKFGFAKDIALMKLVGMLPVIIHGGGPQIKDELTKKGIKSNFIMGQRVTDKETLKIVIKVLGNTINKEIVNLIQNFGGKSRGLMGNKKALVKATKLNILNKDEKVNLGFVGKVKSIDVKQIKALLSKNIIPVIAPLGIDNKQTLNINADLVASKIAASLNAEKLILLTDVNGISDHKNELIPQLNTKKAKLILNKDFIKGGMKPKLNSAVEALESGVKAAHIIDGRVPHAVLLEVLTAEGVGTLLEEK
ncbi:MAG: acetylglutamate kinase [SAR86 cluster bacterium]|jgi:acetylglutamate kinase|nr:acetylglutamate kinase [SAR86 cluster bacterium]